MDASSTVLLTGGSAGIGAAICAQLLAKGCQVINLDRLACPVSHPRLRSIEVDLTDIPATQQLAARLAAQHQITRLVNNAGTIRSAAVDAATLAELDEVVALHLKTPMVLMQAVLPAMRAAGFGRVVNISSRGILGNPGQSTYIATKSGLIGLTRSWALDLASEGITVNAIAPGMIATALMEQALPAGTELRRGRQDKIPMKRLGTPDELAHAVLFFLDDASSYITGQTLYVCGGASMGAVPA